MSASDPREVFSLDRRAVAEAFDRASTSYDAAAALQERVRNELIARVAEKARHQGVRVFLTGAAPQVRRELLIHGARPPVVRYRSDISSAVDEIKR